MKPSAARVLAILPELLCYAATLTMVGLVLLSAGQPLFTEDSWWHLTMGRAYAASGPWLDADPALHTATGPPAPAAWLSQLVIHGIEQAFGLMGVRAVHLLAVTGIFALAGWLLLRTSRSRTQAGLALIGFAILASYRLFQMRPHLITMLATLVLIGLLVVPRRPASPARLVVCAILLALWANSHAGFVLGPVLLLSAAAGWGIAIALQLCERAEGVLHAKWLAIAALVGGLAALANPSGGRQYMLYFMAGETSPALQLIADEWAPLRLWQLPAPNLPPGIMAWAMVWLLAIATPCVIGLGVLRLRRVEAGGAERVASDIINPGLLAVAAVSLVAMLSAVRFLWLGIFPLMALGQAARALGWLDALRRPAGAFAAGVVAILLVAGFMQLGEWRMISKGVHPATYAMPYPPGKYHAHAVWFLRDTGLEGNLYNDYQSGNFLGYWLAPGLRTFINGSLNVPMDVVTAGRIIEQRGWESAESIEEVLDRYEVDVFFGTGLPSVSLESRHRISTTTHLDDTPGWIPVFRSLQSSVHLRVDERNRDNLARIMAYYEDRRVPFDPDVGFDTDRVIREAPRWARKNGLIPVNLENLRAAGRSLALGQRQAASDQLASVYAAIGLYERAEKADVRALRRNPSVVRTQRRLVWSLLRQGRIEESQEAAEVLAGLASPDDALTLTIVEAAREHASLSSRDARALVGALPLFTHADARRLGMGFRGPEVRVR